jgi:hypothetical protein
MSVSGLLDALLTYFNRGILDVPDGLLDRNATFRLNGRAYEEWLGRSSGDPLVRLIARGPAGYRFIATAVLRALEQAHATFGDRAVDDGRASGTVLLMGNLRGSQERFEEVLGLTLMLTPGGSIADAAIEMSEAPLARLKAARAR